MDEERYQEFARALADVLKQIAEQVSAGAEALASAWEQGLDVALEEIMIGLRKAMPVIKQLADAVEESVSEEGE